MFHLKRVISQVALTTNHLKTMGPLFQAFRFSTSSAFKTIPTRSKNSKKRRKKLFSKNGSNSKIPPIGSSTRSHQSQIQRRSHLKTPKNRDSIGERAKWDYLTPWV